MLAADAAHEAYRQMIAAEKLKRFQELVEKSWVKEDLWKVRNFHQAFEHGFFAGMIHTGLQMVTGGRRLWNRYPNKPGQERMRQLKQYYDGRNSSPEQPVYDRKLTFDKLTDVYNSGTAHNEDQPCHLHILQPDIAIPDARTSTETHASLSRRRLRNGG
jgi:electron-transferring-flavoprotein dehydrogenase